MDEIELQLKDYLIKNTEIIKKSLDDNYLNYDFIKINKVEIEDDGFMLYCQLAKNLGDSISFLPLPEKFLRKLKLNQIKLVSLYKEKQ